MLTLKIYKMWALPMTLKAFFVGLILCGNLACVSVAPQPPSKVGLPLAKSVDRVNYQVIFKLDNYGRIISPTIIPNRTSIIFSGRSPEQRTQDFINDVSYDVSDVSIPNTHWKNILLKLTSINLDEEYLQNCDVRNNKKAMEECPLVFVSSKNQTKFVTMLEYNPQEPNSLICVTDYKKWVESRLKTWAEDMGRWLRSA